MVLSVEEGKNSMSGWMF